MTLISSLKNKFYHSKFIILVISSVALCSCASVKSNQIHESDIIINDPMEEQNRKIMAFNQAVDRTIINPIIRGYRTITPQPARSGIRNVLRNLRSPIILTNQLLQGDLNGAGNVLLRAAINSTVGVGGIFDVAGYEGIDYEPEDFGQTLAVWGVGHGPYMVLPFIGPSSLRDYTGYITDSIADPLRIHLFNHDQELLYTAKFGADYLDLRDSLMDTLNEVEESSIDYYAAIRSVYYQNREALVNDQKAAAQKSIPAIPYYED